MAFKHYLEEEDDKPYFTTNSLGYYYDKMEGFAEKVEQAAKTLNVTKEEVEKNISAYIEQNKNELDQRLAQWDGKLETFDSSVETLLSEWVDDGTLNTIIDTTLIDQRIAPVTAQLAETVLQAKRATINNIDDRKVIVSFMDDDGNPRLWDTIRPIHIAENVPCNICVIGSSLPYAAQSISVAQAKELKALGWNVANHTQNHIDMTAITAAKAETEIKPVVDVLKANGLDHDMIVYPYGGYNKNVLDVVRKYNKIGISTTEGINTTPINTFALKRVSGMGETGVTLDSLKLQIDNAPADSWIIFKGHTGYDAYKDPLVVADYLALVQYIKSKGIEIVSIEEGLQRKGNIVDVGTDHQKFQISHDGKVRLNNTFEDYSYNNATPITYFPFGESVTYFNNNEITGKGFPVGDNGGIVKTYRLRMGKYVSEDASYQTFQPYYENSVYRRRWLVATALWGPWELIARKIESSGSVHGVTKSVNAYTFTQPIADYPATTITTHHVNSNGATGFPLNSAGIVTTYRLGGNGYDRQEFRAFDSNLIYVRYTDRTTGVWKPFEPLNSFGIVKDADIYTGNSGVKDFPADKVTTFVSTVATPNGINGVFATHRVRAAGYDYQTFKEYSLNDDFNMYVRNVKSGDVWGLWKQVTLL